ncbi:MAG TPA: IS4 family transposase [Kofleriaceae bacterium]|nr:IS4 family transposase [Kofleriaceae bacterium]
MDFDVRLTEALEYTAAFTPEAFPNLTAHLDPAWVEEALNATGTATVRRRRLPAERTVWLVLAMAVMRDWPIPEVARQLELALPGADGTRTVASSALSQARQRVGPEPLEWLFLRSAEQWATRSADRDRWRGLALYGVDGTTLRVADSPDNRVHFGGHNSGRHDGGREERTSGYPLLRAVVLMALRSHLLMGAAFGPYATDERAYARPLLDSVPDHSLLLVDRLYLQADVLIPLAMNGHERHWMSRAKSTTKYTVMKRLGAGDNLVELTVSRHARSKHPGLPATFLARAIRFQRKGYPPTTLLTSLLDPRLYPAAELRALHHERWEIELGFGEIKTDMLERLETIRSKSPAAVAQEMWGLLTAYNLVRLEMERIAAEIGVPPTRISFVASLRFFVEQWLWASTTATPGAIPQRLSTMRDHVRRFLLPERRPERVFPRAVKIKMSNYARKVPSSTRKPTK